MFNLNFFKKIHKHHFISLVVIFFIFILDRLTKDQIIKYQLENNKLYVNDFVNFDLVWNTGIGFGFLSSSSNIFYNSITFAIGLLIIFLVYLIIKSEFIDRILFSLIVGGALGNFYDRIIYRAVPDFIDLHYLDFHWFVFNVADIFITIGIFCLIIVELFFYKKT